MIDRVFDSLISLFGSLEPVIIILAALPIAEVRLAIPIAVKYGMHPFKAFLLALTSSTAAAAILLAVLLPFIRFLSRTKIFKKAAGAVLKKATLGAEKINKKQNSALAEAAADGNHHNTSKINGTTISPRDTKKMLGIAAFVAVPLPLTGVWSGSLIAGILELKYLKALLAVSAGNLIAAAIVTVASVFFAEYINIMVAVFAVLALAAVVLLLIKAFIGDKNK